ncbi:uncharacterized protein LOC143239166 [Tachypleus tridentatus]|uniref:uncharacterized protein LOC143239166 n=1 Tax=Tachypleus tridentatus TaxID=6853 RepID=UPI003FD4CD2A
MTFEQTCDIRSLLDSWRVEPSITPATTLRRDFKSHSSSCLKSYSGHGNLDGHVWPEIPLSPVVLAPRAWEESVSCMCPSTSAALKVSSEGTSPVPQSIAYPFRLSRATSSYRSSPNRNLRKREDDERPRLSTKTKWIIIVTATTLILMSILLVGVTLRLAPVIDELVRKENQEIYRIWSSTTTPQENAQGVFFNQTVSTTG